MGSWESIQQPVLVFAAALVLSAALTPAVRTFARRVGFCDVPGTKKMHQSATPLLGGLAIALAFGAAVATGFAEDLLLPAMVGGGALVLALGLWDDRSCVRPLPKLAGQLFAAVCLTIFGMRLHVFQAPLLDFPLMLFWVVGITNAFNLSDNMDGISAGLAAIAAFWFFIIGLAGGGMAFAIAAIALCGACLGFLRYNFSPASIFMGDAGSMFIGFTLAVIGIRSVAEASSPLAPAVPVLVLAVPVFDTAFVSWLRRSEGRSIADGGTDHTSHRLVAAGLSVRATSLLLYAVAALTGLAGYVLAFSSFWTGVGVLALAAGGSLIAGRILAKSAPPRTLQTGLLEAP